MTFQKYIFFRFVTELSVFVVIIEISHDFYVTYSNQIMSNGKYYTMLNILIIYEQRIRRYT